MLAILLIVLPLAFRKPRELIFPESKWGQTVAFGFFFFFAAFAYLALPRLDGPIIVLFVIAMVFLLAYLRSFRDTR